MAGILNMIATAFKAAVSTGDAFFNLVTLLLNTNSTNGAQNNTFLDSSSIGNTVTRNGTPTQGTFTPFSQTGWSNYFSSSSSLSIPSGASISGTGNFTVEMWIFPISFGSSYQIMYANDTSGGLSLGINSTGTIFYGRSLVAIDGTTTGTVTFNSWNHIAFVRSGTGTNQMIVYINGSSAGTFTNSTNYASGAVRIANDGGGGGSAQFNSYISNLRTGTTAVYSSSFTPSTTPLTAITGTTLLTCQSNRFVDNSTNAYTITVAGSPGPSVQAFSPFLPTAAYDTAVVGGSGLFVRANSDILTLPNNSLLVGSSDFSLETWAYQFDRSGSMNFFGNQTDRATAGGSSWNIAFTNTNGYVESTTWVGGTPYNLTTSTAPPLNAWNHIVWCRTGGTQSIFVNGVRGATRSDMGTLSVNNGSTSFPPAIGANGGSASDILNGYLSGFKIIIGSGGYDATASTLTIPTAPPTNTTNTKLLVNFTNAGIFDSAAKNDLQTVGNAQVSTTQAKWGTTSMYFDGTGDYLVAPSNQLYNFRTGDFTIECWVRLITVNTAKMIVSTNYDSSTGGGGWAFVHRADISSLMFTCNANVTYTKSWSPSANTWYHIAVCRSGTSLRLFVDGTQIGTTSTSTDNITGASTLVVAGNLGGGANLTLDAYMDDLRITNYARYTANFTPPTAAFPLQ